MHHLKQLSGAVCLALILFATCILLFAAQGNVTVVQAEQAVTTAVIPLGGFTNDGTAVNEAATSGATPALAIQSTGAVWTALRQASQILVRKFNPDTHTWMQQGGVLNNNAGSNPALGFGGANDNTAWAAWTETIDHNQQVMTARFDGSTWQPTGMLNLPAQAGDQAALATGATVTDARSLPWVAWKSTSGIAVKRAITDSVPVVWESVGDTLVIAAGATAGAPDLVFAGAEKHTPWLAWSESDSNGHFFVFGARAVADNSAPGGLRWQAVGKVADCTQTNCTLNANTQQATQDVQLTAGALVGETTPTPWLVFATTASTTVSEIRVMRLDDGATPSDLSDDRFIPAGAALNTQCLGNAGITSTNGSQPDIFFVGAVPHVAWIETVAGVGQLFVCHLADTRPGQERWDLDTVYAINRSAFAPAAAPMLGGDGNTSYVAWQEGEGQSDVWVAHRYPDGPAWGRNYPPFIRTISWSRNFVGRVYPEDELARAIETLAASTNPLTLTTSCYHVDGWEHIAEIQFKVANEKLTAFSGKYVAAEDNLYVENPDQPGTFLGGVKPGSTTPPIETAIATLYVADMRVRAHGNSSPVLDIDWIISFKEPTMFQDLKQMINIVYDDGKATGFFETGVLSFDYRIYMPVVQR